MTPNGDSERPDDIERFLGAPTRDLDDWHDLWTRDLRFPVASERPGVLGRLSVWLRRRLRPVLRAALGDLWDRQRVFNLVLLEEVSGRLEPRLRQLEERIASLEAVLDEGLRDVTRYNDALYSRVDVKLDRFEREARALLTTLRARADELEHGDREATIAAAQKLQRGLDETDYRLFEDRHRGTETEIADRLEAYRDDLKSARRVLDLGCGRGEALAWLEARGAQAVGVDLSSQMVAACRERDLDARWGDLLEFLGRQPAESFDAVLSFHVIEHLGAEEIGRLLTGAHRALRPGGVLVLETPSCLSLVAGARNFWRDPTHRRPVHPDFARLAAERAGFESVEIRALNPFPSESRLPEVSGEGAAAVNSALASLVEEIHRLRDRLDDVLYGDQDYALIARRPPTPV